MRIVSLCCICVCFLMLAGCGGSSPEGTLDPSPATPEPVATDKIEIPTGATASAVIKLLGPADATEPGGNGREIWRYANKRAEYAYVSNRGNTQTLVLGKYTADPEADTPGQSMLLTIIFDATKKVVDFTFSMMAF